MSSAVNHAKRSHRSHARHYRATGLRKITAMHQQERRGLNRFLKPGFFKPRRREHTANSPERLFGGGGA